jgi:hypothetical protein
MQAMPQPLTAAVADGDPPGPQRRLMGSRAVLTLVGLALAAYALAFVLPNFEFCYYSCGTPAGWEYVFGTTFGNTLVMVPFVLAHVSFWLTAASLLFGVRRRWAAIAMVPYAAFCGWLVWLLIAYQALFDLRIGWWLWFAAAALLVTAILADGAQRWLAPRRHV